MDYMTELAAIANKKRRHHRNENSGAARHFQGDALQTLQGGKDSPNRQGAVCSSRGYAGRTTVYQPPVRKDYFFPRDGAVSSRISDRTPFEHTVTAPSGCIPSAAIKAECKVYYIKPELFELGKTILQTPAGNPVPCYDLERTICDVIRSRNKIGTETFLSALKQYAVSPKKDLNRLDEYARQMRVSGVLRQYLEVLL